MKLKRLLACLLVLMMIASCVPAMAAGGEFFYDDNYEYTEGKYYYLYDSRNPTTTSWYQCETDTNNNSHRKTLAEQPDVSGKDINVCFSVSGSFTGNILGDVTCGYGTTVVINGDVGGTAYVEAKASLTVNGSVDFVNSSNSQSNFTATKGAKGIKLNGTTYDASCTEGVIKIENGVLTTKLTPYSGEWEDAYYCYDKNGWLLEGDGVDGLEHIINYGTTQPDFSDNEEFYIYINSDVEITGPVGGHLYPFANVTVNGSADYVVLEDFTGNFTATGGVQTLRIDGFTYDTSGTKGEIKIVDGELVTKLTPYTGKLNHIIYVNMGNGWFMTAIDENGKTHEADLTEAPDLTADGIYYINYFGDGKSAFKGNIKAEYVALRYVPSFEGNITGTLLAYNDITVNGKADTVVFTKDVKVTLNGSVKSVGYIEYDENGNRTYRVLPFAYEGNEIELSDKNETIMNGMNNLLTVSVGKGTPKYVGIDVVRYADDAVPSDLKTMANLGSGFFEAFKVEIDETSGKMGDGSFALKILVGADKLNTELQLYTRVGKDVKKSTVKSDDKGYVVVNVSESCDIVIRTFPVALENEPAVKTTTDTSGLTVANAKVKVEQIAVNDLPDTVKEKISQEVMDEVDLCVAFDVTLTAEQKAIYENFGVLTLKFEVGKDYAGQKMKIYHVHGDEILEYTATVDADGFVAISVDKLSTFVVRSLTEEEKKADQKAEAKKEEEKKTNPVVPATGDDSDILLWTLVLAGAVLSLVTLKVIVRKKENN